MRHFLSLVTLCWLSFSLGQNALPNDLVLNDLKGKVKQVEEMVTMPDVPVIKKIYNFDQRGLLTTVIEYSEYYTDKDSLAVSKTYHYKNTDRTRIFYALDEKSKDTTDMGTFKVLGNGKIALDTNFGVTWVSYSEFIVTDNLLTERFNKIVDSETNTEMVSTHVKNSYENGLLVEMTIDNGTISETTQVQNLDIDKFGNVLIQQYVNAEDKMVYDIRRKIVYYD
ncbi:hypothetical protein [Winogradskyella flava]|uniref:YD repeat-containing protein n=1 Tax=Winogradskyella flava TaxID=1884876 RepID=A0A842IU60_9FLAO|nr:hypothetical protein [Winogradskyella flava]MBC2844917.1 hypothetical protein [Winogradskyella flava]